SSGSDPNNGGTGVEVDINSTDDTSTIVAAVANALNATGIFSASASNTTVTVTNLDGGNVTDASDNNVGSLGITVAQQGDSNNITQGSYFTFDTPTDQDYV